MPTEHIVTALKIYGGAAYYSAMRQASASTQNLAGSQSALESTARSVGGKLDNLAGSIGRVGSQMAGLAITTAAGAAAMGLKFDAMIERSEIGIKTLVGSASEARKITAEVREFALEAPLFGTEQMIKTAQQLIGAGYDAKNIVPYLRTFSDTLSAMGRKPEDLQRMTYAFVQMMNKGKVSAEELQGQLGEIFPAQKLLAREMGLTGDQMAKKMKKGSIRGQDAILLLLRGMEQDFGGATKEMAKTFDGQLANMKESAKYSLGILFEPLFKELRDDVFPLLAKFGTVWTDVLNDNNLTAEQKLKLTGELWNAYIMPKVHEFGDALEKMDIGTKLGNAISKALPVISSTMGKLGVEALKAFGKAWWESDIWGKLFLGSILLSKIVGFKALFGTIGRRAAAYFAARFAATTVATQQMTLFDDAGKKGGGRWGKAFGAAAGVAVVFALGQIAVELENWIKKEIEKHPWMGGPTKPGSKQRKKSGEYEGLVEKYLGINIEKIGKDIADQIVRGFTPPRHRQLGGPVAAGQPYIVGERRPELFVPTMSGSIKPALGGAMTIVVQSVLDRRIIAESVYKHNIDQMSRR